MSQLIQQQVHVFLERLHEVLENQYGDMCEVEGNGRYLELTLPSGQVFLLNFHEPTQQIWLSSPFSGAHHYVLVDEEWCSTRSSETLISRLSSELEPQFGQAVVLK